MSGTRKEFDVIVVGAGVAGIYQIKRLIDLGVDAIVLEGNEDLGGTWFKNRYPGCRFDSESYTYGYSFSQELLNEWHWKERFSSQPENLKYMNFVADKFGLRRFIKCGTSVERMVWNEADRSWSLTDQSGGVYTARFVITCMGVLSVPVLPKIKGIDAFKGESFHSFHWPDDPLKLAGRRVGVVGTGATGIQIISEIADKAGELFVFQRNPNWSVPLNNSPISQQEMEDIRQRYDEIFANCEKSHGGFEHQTDPRRCKHVTRDERLELWDKLYDTPGFALLLANFPDTYFEEGPNRELSDYIAERIRKRVHDPKIAEKLIPKDHGFGMKRVPLETKYFEAYNRDNVHLIDLKETPIECVTENGIRTSSQDIDLDVIVYATGFDPAVGALEHIDIHGTDHTVLRDKWKGSPSTYLGVLTHGFPNLFMVAGPQSVSGSTNYPRAIETGVDWVTDLFAHVRKGGSTRVEVQAEAEKAWVEEVRTVQEKMPFNKVKSWFTGFNPNIARRDPDQVRYIAYWGGGPRYREHLQNAVDEGYQYIEIE